MISPKGAISPLATARISTGTATTTSATTPSHLSTMTPSRGKDVNQPIIKVQPLMYRRFVLCRLRDPTPTQPWTTLFEGLSKTRFPLLTRHCNAKPIQDDMLEPKCSKDFYDQSGFYNCTEWVFSDADHMDGTKAFSFEFYLCMSPISERFWHSQ